jgi:PBP4 family serine-type D-alanyl-D-alanine carboxypeptidase
MVAIALAVTLSLNQIAAQPRLAHAIVAGEVYDLDAKRVLWSRNPRTLVVGASTTKLLTNGTTLALLGPGFRFTTPVYRTGPLDEHGVLHGDLVLVASGDPNLSQRIQPDGSLAFENEDHAYAGSYDTRAVPGDPLAVLRGLAQQVVQAGIKRVDGTVTIDTSLFPDQGPEGGTGIIQSSIVVNDNIVDVTIAPGAKPGDPVTVAASPQTPYVTFVNKATTGPADAEPTIDLSNDVKNPDGTHTVTIVGMQPSKAPILYAYRVPEPAAFAKAAFTVALQDAGVAVAGTSATSASTPAAYTDANLVARHISPPIAQDVLITLKVSDNLHAALQPYLWAVYVAHAKSDWLNAGFAQERALLQRAGLDLGGAVQNDGPGMSALYTPEFMVRYLSWVHEQSWFDALYDGLPILGVDGTLFNIQNGSPAKGKVFAKTGTDGIGDLLAGPSAEVISKGLAGYMTTKSGHHVAFAFYIDRVTGIGSVDTSKDVAHYAGEQLGAMATAAYLAL